jgi:hypothetical protein
MLGFLSRKRFTSNIQTIIMNSTKERLNQSNTKEIPSSDDGSQLQDQATGDIIAGLSGLTLDSEAPQTYGDQDAASLATPTDNSPALDFGGLLTEIRLMIWRVLLLQPRIIEIEAKPGGDWNFPPSDIEDGDASIDDGKYMVSHHSREPPVILHICRESREEALNAYKLMPVYLLSIERIYFNPLVDVIYFGQNCCTETMNDLLGQCWATQRVAVDLSMQKNVCCHGNEEDGDRIKVMRAFHDLKHTSDLKDIFFITSTTRITDFLSPQDNDLEWSEEWSCALLKDVPSVIRNIDSVGFYAAQDEEFPTSERVIKEHYETEIRRGVDGHALSGADENLWSKDIPTFHFAKFCERKAFFNPLSRRRRRTAKDAPAQPSIWPMKVGQHLDPPLFDDDWVLPGGFQRGPSPDSDMFDVEHGAGGLIGNAFYDIWDGYDRTL